jgi:HTH-type transcriptional regulator, sugar sensing transcriptional regulator
LLKNKISLGELEIEALTNFGLTSTQARVYLCLNTLGKSNAKNITTSTGISRQDIYRVLTELFEMGLVEKTVSSPTEFKAISVDKCISLLLQKRKKETIQMQKAASKITRSKLTSKPQENSEEKNSQLLILSPGDLISFEAHELIKQAQTTIYVISPSKKLFPWVHNDSDALEKALSRNVRIRFITDLERNPNQLMASLLKLEGNSLFEIKYFLHPLRESFGLYDNNKMVMELVATGGFLDSQTIITENPCLIEMAKKYFDLMWIQAKPQNR